ncbi:DNA-directed RNA polymerase subunit A' [Candidatus Woesearchaeota archaeon B3_Woes]|nr:MAG: DNA-directed RNA polymerase subunit A' [Candidatus Woesearchaeota archaeon B3_Woes]
MAKKETKEKEVKEPVEEKAEEVVEPIEETKEVPEVEDLPEEKGSKEPVEEKKIDFESHQHVHKQIRSIEFGTLSPELIKKMASAKIVTPELYDREGYPVDGGLMDIRLGVIDPGLKCKTCGSKLKECIGHFGYIELARPIIHIKFVSIILNILKSTCRDCGRVLIPKTKIAKCLDELKEAEKESGLAGRRKKIRQIITNLKSQNKCPYCQVKQQKINLEKPSTFIENEKRISPIEVRTRLEKVTDDDLSLFGINAKVARPEWMVLTIMAIPPVTMRPSITLESGERSEDDLTHKIGDIVRINQRLFENINAGAPEIIIEDLWDLLQYHVTTFFDNAVAQLPPARHRSGQPLKTITERIKSKQGRIRQNLAGKRTNFSSRTVISPDPNLQLNEVGVPMEIATILTVPERVTEWNIEYLKGFIKRGSHVYPGANYVIRPGGKKKRITEETKEASLEEIEQGYIVERHLLDGDVAIFNRQPSLHRMSMMCHKVRILAGKTFRLSPAVCNPYNADFDGDEMNLHIPQTEEARAEAEILMQVQTQLISPRYGLSVMGCKQDAISGNYILTTNNFKMKRDDAVDLLYNLGINNFSKLPKKKEVSGQEVFSTLLPDDFDFKGTDRTGKPVIIKNGVLNEGCVIDKNAVGEEAGLILRALHKKYGADDAVIIISNIFRLGIGVLLKNGFSITLSDTDLPKNAREEVDEIFTNVKQDVQNLINSYYKGELEVFPGKTASETLELRILELLNKERNKVGQVVMDYCHKGTSSIIMADSGARGNSLNLAQMAACVGQQAMRGQRITKGYNKRTLSSFKKGDLGSESHGFIQNGFKQGLNPFEFFFGSITGRDSLMDTALRTPKSGYLYRRLSNALQDLKVEYDHTVRDASKKIIQFKYGEDGVDVSKSEEGVINVDRVIK